MLVLTCHIIFFHMVDKIKHDFQIVLRETQGLDATNIDNLL
jgi:hypothetical protein